jgi:outer membrane protein insertion porin family
MVFVGLVCLLALLAPRPALADPGARFGLAPDTVWQLVQFPEVDGDVWGEPIAEIRFKGNQRVEAEAMQLELVSRVGKPVRAADLANDLKRLWALGYFEDVSVEGEVTASGVLLTYVVRERPTVRKIVVDGNDKVKLDDINEQLDLEKNEVLDLGKVKANVEKVRQLYTQEGFFLADVDYAVRPVDDEPGKVDVVFVISEAAEVVVKDITFVGNKAIGDDVLRKQMFTRVGGYLALISKKAGGVYNREAFTQDYANVRGYYADQGYLDADVKDAELALSPDRRFVYVTVPVIEGPQYRIGEIRAREVTAGEDALFSPETLAESIDPILKVGDIASAGKIRTIAEDIERRYKDSGYAYVNVIPNSRQDRESLKVYVVFEVQKGPLVYIERINIFGNEKTADKVIRREMRIREGQLYSITGKELSEVSVLRLGYFNEATISESRGSGDDKIVLNVEVDERLTGTFQIGAGFSTIENFVLQAQISYDNFLGRGSTVQLVAQVSSLRRLFNLRYYTRYFLNSRWQFDANIFNSANIFPSFFRESTGFGLQWGYPLPKRPNLVFWAGYDFEYVRASFGSNRFGNLGGIFAPGSLASIPSGALIGNLFNNGITSSVVARITYDSRDNFLFPTQGMFHQIRAQFASRYFGSQNEYNRYALDSRFYVPVVRTEKQFRAWVVFKSRFQLGFIHGPSERGVPVFERYFPGGMFGDGSIRGYRLRTLGPLITVQSSPDPTARQIGYNIGGNLLAALNLELEFMIVPPANIKGVIFLDAGNAFNTERQYCRESNPSDLPKSDPCTTFRLRDLRAAMGFGFRWQSPIGPLRFEWGFPLDRQRATALRFAEEPVVFEFNVGTGF